MKVFAIMALFASVGAVNLEQKAKGFYDATKFEVKITD